MKYKAALDNVHCNVHSPKTRRTFFFHNCILMTRNNWQKERFYFGRKYQCCKGCKGCVGVKAISIYHQSDIRCGPVQEVKNVNIATGDITFNSR